MVVQYRRNKTLNICVGGYPFDLVVGSYSSQDGRSLLPRELTELYELGDEAVC